MGRFTTNGYKIYDTFHDGTHWLVNTVEAVEIVEVMNNLDLKARERSKALSKLQKENEELKKLLECSRNEAEDYCEELMCKDSFINLYKRQRDEYKEIIESNNRLRQKGDLEGNIMANERFKIVHLRKDICDIQDTRQEVPTFYVDLTYNFGSANMICELLNQLDNDNEQLKVECKELGYANDIYCESIDNLKKENKELKTRINSRLHYYRQFYDECDEDDGFLYHVAKRIVEDLEDILR